MLRVELRKNKIEKNSVESTFQLHYTTLFNLTNWKNAPSTVYLQMYGDNIRHVASKFKVSSRIGFLDENLLKFQCVIFLSCT